MGFGDRSEFWFGKDPELVAGGDSTPAAVGVSQRSDA